MLARRFAGLAVALFLLSLTGCRNHSTSGSQATNGSEKPVAADEIRLIFSYGSEKQKWIEDVTAAFNASGAKTANGKRITVKAIPKGSGECIDDLLSGKEQDDVISPASNVFIK